MLHAKFPVRNGKLILDVRPGEPVTVTVTQNRADTAVQYGGQQARLSAAGLRHENYFPAIPSNISLSRFTNPAGSASVPPSASVA